MTTPVQSQPTFHYDLRPCTPEEEAEILRLHAEAQQNQSYLAEHRDELIHEHRGQFALIYCDAAGVTRVHLDDHQGRLRDSVDEDRLPSAILEYLDDVFEIWVPTVYVEPD